MEEGERVEECERGKRGRGRERIVIEGVCVNSIERQLSNVAIDNTNIGIKHSLVSNTR